MKVEVGSRIFRFKKKKFSKEVLDLDVTLFNSLDGKKFFEKLCNKNNDQNKIIGLRLRIMSEDDRQHYIEAIVKDWAMTPFRT